MALATMVRPDLEGEIVKTVGSLNINERLLHYVVVHWLTPRPSNYAKFLKEDIFMIWALKNNICINWPHHIMQTMLRSKGGDAPLPYGILITRIMQYSGVDLSVDASTTIGLRQQFSTNSLKKLNIVNVNGVWQHAHANEHDQVQGQPESPFHEVQHEPQIHPNAEVLNQIWGSLGHANYNAWIRTHGWKNATD